MLDIDNITLDDLDTTLYSVNDKFLSELKRKWFEESQKPIDHSEFVQKANRWFLDTKLNKLEGTEKFPCSDIIMGCTHFIESLASKHKWDIQILEKEYAYYTVMGKHHTTIENLKPNRPLIVSLPNYYYGSRPEWQQVLQACEQKNIDIHIDCAWLTAAKGFEFNFDHPNIKSFAMSMSKYNFTWNRIGLRWSRQRTMDSCSLISAQKKYNELTTACGSYMMDNVPRDYGWETYGDAIDKICNKLKLQKTMYFYIVKDEEGRLYSIGNILGRIKQ